MDILVFSIIEYNKITSIFKSDLGKAYPQICKRFQPAVLGVKPKSKHTERRLRDTGEKSRKSSLVLKVGHGQICHFTSISKCFQLFCIISPSDLMHLQWW